nr:HPP family protein [uncultured Holophaga sp.]
MKARLRRFPGKLRGQSAPMRGRPSLKFAVWSVLSGATGILAILKVATWAGQPLLIGSFGASAVLLFGAPDSPLAQPRNLIGGHLFSALVAILLVKTLGPLPWVAALGVGLSIGLMHLTHTTHPPGGATALIGILGHASWMFVAVPVLAGALVLLGMALLTNNLVHHRHYPRHWL